MLRVWLWKEGRELRLQLLMSCAVLLVVRVGLAWALPEVAPDMPWFAVGPFVAALVLGSELVGGEARRGQLDFLARLPHGLRSAFAAKLAWLALGVLACGAAGYAAEGLARLVCGGPWVPWSDVSWSLMAWAVAVATWLITTGCWWPGGFTALGIVMLIGAVFTAPLVPFAVGRAGIHPIPLPFEGTGVYAACAGLALCWLGIRRVLARPRERRRVRSYLAAVGLAFVPLWAMGAHHVWRWHHVDVASADIQHAFVDPGHRRAYLTLSQPLLRDRPLHYTVLADLETGDWEQVGSPNSHWETLHGVEPGVSFTSLAAATNAVLRGECAPDGQSLVLEIVDTTSGRVLATASKYALLSLPETLLEGTGWLLSPYRTGSGERFYVARGKAWVVGADGSRRTVPWREGDYPLFQAGRGFSIANKPGGATSRRYFDLERMRVFELEANVQPVIRRGAWLAQASGRQLFWPETGATAPVRGLEHGESWGPLIDDRRFAVYRKDQPGLSLLDPETGERSPLRAPSLGGAGLGWVGNPIGSHGGARTPSGAPILQLNVDGRGTCFAKLVGDELVCTPCPTQGLLELVACPDEDAVLAIVNQQTLERLRFGEPRREVLFPR